MNNAPLSRLPQKNAMKGGRILIVHCSGNSPVKNILPTSEKVRLAAYDIEDCIPSSYSEIDSLGEQRSVAISSGATPMKRALSPVFKVVVASIVLTTGVMIGWPDLGRSQGEPEPTEVLHVTDEPLTIRGALNSESEVLAQDGTYYNTHTFHGEAGQTLIIEMRSDEFDTYLSLRNGEGNEIAANDDSKGTNSRISLTLPATSTYTVIANSYSAGETGNYTLTIQAASQDDLALAEADHMNQQVLEFIEQGNGRYADILAIAQEALEIRERILGANHADVITSINNLAFLYQDQGLYTQAESLFERALTSREEVLPENHPDIALSLNNLAGLYFEQGDYAQAELLFERALDTWEEILGANHPDVATALNNLALVYRAQGNYSQAEPLFKRALSIFEAELGVDHPDVASILSNLALLYFDQGRYAQVEQLLQRSLSIREAALGSDHIGVALSLSSLGTLYQNQGNYAQAEPILQRALAIREAVLGPNHPLIATSLNNLAALHDDQGDYTQAQLLYQRALSIVEASLPANHPAVALSLQNLATLYFKQGDYVQAEQLFQQALSIREAALGVNHPDVAVTLGNLAMLYQEQGNYAQAEPLIHRSLSIRETALGVDHPDFALSLNNLAEFYREQGDYVQAEQLFQRSLTIWEATLGAYHPNVASSLNNLSVIYQAQGDSTDALAWLHRAVNVEETNLALTLSIGSEARKRAYIATLNSTTHRAISLHLQAQPINSSAASLATTVILQRKGRVLDAVTDNLQQLRQNLDAGSRQLLDDLQATHNQLVALRFQGLDNQTLENYQAELTQLETEAEKLANTLAQRSAEFLVESAPVTIAAVQAQIPADGVLIEFFRYQPFNPTATSLGERWGNPRYAAYILHPDGTTHGIDLGDAEPIDQAVTEYLKQLQRPASLNAARAAGRTLDALILQPIRSHLGSAQHLLISPDGQINLIPFAALVDENDQYLIENYTLTTLASGRDLLKLQLDRPSQQEPVIIANPDFNTANSLVARVPDTSNTRSSDAQRSIDLATLDFAPLPGTQLEAEAIAPLLPNATLLTGADATEAALTQLNAPSILHLATHGYFLNDLTPIVSSSRGSDGTIELIPAGTPPTGDDVVFSNENPLLRSGLALANFNPPRDEPGNNDGVLSALEVSSLNLYGTDLVVLSACQTGVGDVVNGEGVYGLRRAFALAGAESLLMSLWKVDDYGTAELMRRYYDRLINDNEGRSEALRQVQLELMNAPAYEHPYYWAAFMFSGDWRPLKE